VNPNVLVFSGREGESLGTEQTIKQTSVRTMPVNELVSVRKSEEREVKPTPSVALETDTLKPLTFIPRNSKPKTNIRPNRTQSLLKSLLNRFR